MTLKFVALTKYFKDHKNGSSPSGWSCVKMDGLRKFTVLKTKNDGPEGYDWTVYKT